MTSAIALTESLKSLIDLESDASSVSVAGRASSSPIVLKPSPIKSARALFAWAQRAELSLAVIVASVGGCVVGSIWAGVPLLVPLPNTAIRIIATKASTMMVSTAMPAWAFLLSGWGCFWPGVVADAAVGVGVGLVFGFEV